MSAGKSECIDTACGLLYTHGMRVTSALERFENCFDMVQETGCWVWKRARGPGGRYGMFSMDGRTQRAHRVAWSLYRGDVPEGQCVLHNCPAVDNPACVNPDHLFLGTQAENMRDMHAKGRHRPATGPRPRRLRADALSTLIPPIRCTTGEYAAWHQKAAEAGMTFSAWLRAKLNG